MRVAISGTNRRQIQWIGVVCAIVFGLVGGLPESAESGSDGEILMRLPAANQQVRPQLAALQAMREQSPEQVLIQAQDTFALMRVSGEEKLGGMIERALTLSSVKASLPAKLMLADLYQYQHRFDDALALLVTVEDQASVNPAYWRLRANLYPIQGQTPLMADACARGAAIERSPWTVLCTGEIAMLQGQRAAIHQSLDELLTHHGSALHSNADLLIWAADLFDRVGRPEQASAYLRKALLVGPRAYTVDRLIQFQLQHEGADAAAKTLQWWQKSGHAPFDSWALSAALIAAAQGDRLPAVRLLASLEEALSDHMQLPGANVHWRELARLSLALEPASETTREYALNNWHQQKEPIDAALLAQAANASNHEPSLRELAAELQAKQLFGLQANLTRRGWL